MKVATSVKQDIFELVLDFYRSPSDFSELLDAQQPLPDDITDLLELTSGEVQARTRILTRAAANEAPSELIDATSYFAEQVLFAPGGDHYRILGLNHDASMDDIRKNYELIISLFYQDNEDNAIQSNEVDLSRLNRAYSILRDENKREIYDKSLEIQGRLHKSTTEEIEKEKTKPALVPEPVIRQEDTNKPSAVVELSSNNLSNDNEKRSKQSGQKTLPKILIVDDSATVRAGLSLTLNKEFGCITAKDGEKGWKILQEQDDILIVLTDLDMPVLNGYEFTKRIRASNDERIKSLPVIVVTGTEDMDAKQKALNEGADDFLAKSTDYIEVLTRVKAHYKFVSTKQELIESKAQKILPSSPEPIYAIDKSDIEDRDVPLLSTSTNRFSPVMTIGAFGLVAVVIVTLIYLTQIKPEEDRTMAVETGNSITNGSEDNNKPNSNNNTLNTESGNEILREESSIETDNGFGNTANQSRQGSGLIAREAITKSPKINIKQTEIKPKDEIKKQKNIIPSKIQVKKEVSSPDKAQVKVDKLPSKNNKPDPKAVQRPEQPVKKLTKENVITKDKNVDPEPIANISASTPENLNKVEDSHVPTPGSLPTAQIPTGIANETKIEPVVSLGNVAGRLPAIDAPSVNKINLDTKISDDKNIALLEPLEPVIEEPKITINQRELALFIFKFIRSYEDGNLFQFMNLFDNFAKTDDRSNKDGIRDDYKDLFEKSAARRFTLGDLAWKYENNTAKGSGFFEVQIWPRGSNQHKIFTGEITISVEKWDSRGLVITELYHKF